MVFWKSKLESEVSDKVAYVTYIIPQFAAAYKMNFPQAYQYLKKYGGLDYIFKNWWALHTDSDYWALRSIYDICYQNGGLR
ncbi:MAG: DUF3791 domain-containing protein [Bacteroidales bacterium]|jgi:hypothetical protein|nr:DUF3791 domain-containing protein [Bacteroidales bacterium]